ncbi:unnamed protein product [Alopecurus aequalis]
MEELWKDMSLTSTPAALQYHLGYPPAAYLRHDCHLAVPQPPRTPPHTATALTLSPSLEFTCLGHASASSNSTSSGDDSLHHMPDPFGTDILSSFGATGGSNSNSRRFTVQSVGSDRRNRRMIKNRESAARSRARKQAYTNQLELELARLRKENAMLREREQELHARLALPSGGAPAGNFRSEIARLKKMFFGQIQAKTAACKLPGPGSAPEQATPLALAARVHQRCRSAPPPSL